MEKKRIPCRQLSVSLVDDVSSSFLPFVYTENAVKTLRSRRGKRRSTSLLSFQSANLAISTSMVVPTSIKNPTIDTMVIMTIASAESSVFSSCVWHMSSVVQTPTFCPLSAMFSPISSSSLEQLDGTQTPTVVVGSPGRYGTDRRQAHPSHPGMSSSVGMSCLGFPCLE